MTAANPADAGSTAANLSFQTGRRGNSFAPEILLDKLRSVLGADFGDALSKKELRTRLTALDDAVEAAARKLTKINAGVLPELPFVVEKHNVLDDLLNMAAPQGVKTFDNLMQLSLWDEAFPRLGIAGKMQKRKQSLEAVGEWR